MTDPLHPDVSAPEKADMAVARAVSPYRHTPVVRGISHFAKLGNQPPLMTVSTGVFGIGLLTGNKRLARAGLRMIAANSLALVAKNFVKERVDRTRPELLIREGRYEMRPGTSNDHAQRSFPSGHSACATATARAFAREYPEYGQPAKAASSLVALSQVPRGTHYPTDVVAGSVIGFLAEWAVNKLLPRRRHKLD
ncbi:MAG: phosphatase PAP2 family protein [Verrucomicrobiaceae bacterium]|nr:MAG: phosphatase PAP2 family protein [Verrucomicrobiaceae bacterium]